jgi:hypothetical protein
MQRHIAILILLVNFVATVAGIRTINKMRQRSDALPQTELEAGLTSYLATANTPDQMKDRSAELARIMVNADSVVEGSHILVRRCLKYLCLLGTFNFVFSGAGIWMARQMRPKPQPNEI